MIQPEIPIPGGGSRRYDIAQDPSTVQQGQRSVVFEHKSGAKTYNTEEVQRQIAADVAIRANGNHEVIWLFDGDISTPLKNNLELNGIDYEINGVLPDL